MIITLQGNLVLVELDGKATHALRSGRQRPPRAEAMARAEARIQAARVGYIGLQTHDPGDIVYFKEVSVRPLPAP